MALAAACRLTVGLVPGAAIGATLSAPLPGPEGHILFPPCDRPLELMNASALLVIAQDGQIVAGQGGADMGEAGMGEAGMGEAGMGEPDREAAAFHAAFHEAAERGCLAHLPAPHASALMLSPEGGLDQLTIGGMRFVGEVAEDCRDEIASLDGADAGRRLAALLGERHILMSASAGLFVAEATISRAVHQLYNLERAARIQVLAMSSGRATRSIRPGVPGYDEGRSERRRFQAQQHFAALMRVLDREDASYRD